MADKDDNKPEDNAELRRKLEEALANLQTANATIATQRADAAFSGVQVSDRQRKIILRELSEDKVDVTAEHVAEVAKELGFVTDQAPPPPSDQQQQQQQQDQNGNSQGDTQQQNQQQQQGQQIMVSLDEMSVIDRANYNARRGNISQDLDTKMKSAKSPEELTSIIRNEGAKSGLVHEWDVD